VAHAYGPHSHYDVILTMMSFATKLATPNVTDVQTYGHLTAFNIKITMGKVKDRVASKELRDRLQIDDVILVLQQNRLRWYVLREEDADWVKKCMEYELEGSRPRGRPKRTWTEVVQKDCQAHKLNREDAMDALQTFPGQSLSRTDISWQDTYRTRRFQDKLY